MVYLKIYNSFNLGVFTSERKNNVLFSVRLDRNIVKKLKEIAAKERRNINVQLQIIFEEWLKAQTSAGKLFQALEGQTISDVGPLKVDEGSTKYGHRKSEKKKTG